MHARRIISSPGRICLIGEHQDYFGLPVISAAINKRISVTIEDSGSDACVVEAPDVNERYEFSLRDVPLAYAHKRDYIRSAVNLAHRKGWIHGNGFKAVVRGDIPMQAGVSSSSAMCTAWGAALRALYTGDIGTPAQRSFFGFETEVREFGEPGGMQDHISSAYGGMVYMDFRQDPPPVETLAVPQGIFILGDSQEPKATIEGILRIKNGVYAALEEVKKHRADATLAQVGLEEARLALEKSSLSKEQQKLLLGTLTTRDLTQQAHELFTSKTVSDDVFGELIEQQHASLRDLLGISTPKIEHMIDAAREAGARGCKIVGSGGGGCMLAYAPHDPEKIAAAIEQAGGAAIRIHIDEGTRME